MHPIIQLWIDAKKATSKAQKLEDKALARTEKVKAPKNLRPATAKDIKVGAIIWYDLQGEAAWVAHWKMVEEVFNPNDDWKAFVAHDGCRYGLDNAYVERRGKR